MKCLRAIVLGAGYRGCAYAAYAQAHPDQLEIVGVADPKQATVIPAASYWSDWRACLEARPQADIVMITLPDALHYEAAMMALAAGYHLLLEKPISPTEQECREVVKRAHDNQRLIIVGHVLRYTSYFSHIKALVDSGELGDVVSICHQESVGYRKFAQSFVRGNWANAELSSPIILQKCSHDFDQFSWWLGKRKCRKVSSFGSLRLFRREMMPKGAAAHCAECPTEIESNCIWSARKLDDTNDICVFQANNDVPDHQTVMLEFEDGVTVSHVMTGFTQENVRTTRIALTRGEIVGDGEKLEIFRFDGNSVETRVPTKFRLTNPSRHGGGDFNLVSEMLRILDRHDAEEIRQTTEEALQSHLISFAAEKSRLNGGQIVEIN